MRNEIFSWSNKEPVSKFYSVGAELGTGQFAVVSKCIEIETNKEYAMKCINKKGSSTQEMTSEVEIMKKLDHPGILNLVHVFETEVDLILILELVKGGELFDRIIEKGHYTEKDSCNLLRELLHCTDYLHKNNIVHRDYKPENLLYLSQDEDSVIKIADFGLAREIGNTVLYGVCGTPGYMAPEMVHFEGYSKPADMYSLGVILYILLCGYPPFDDDEFEYDFMTEEWDEVSDKAKSLVDKLLEMDPLKRLSAQEALEECDHWFSVADDSKAKTAAQSALKKYQARRRLRKGIMAVRMTGVLQKLAKVRLASVKSESASKEEKKEEPPKMQASTYFRMVETTLTESLNNIRIVLDKLPEMMEEINTEEEKAETLPVIENIFRTMNEIDTAQFSHFKEIYLEHFLPKSSGDTAQYL